MFRHADGRMVVVPHHAGEDIRPGLVRDIIRAAGVDVETFLAKA